MDNKAKRMRDMGILPILYLISSNDDYYRNMEFIDHLLGIKA